MLTLSSRTVRNIFIKVYLFSLTLCLFAQTKPDVRGFNQPVFDYHFSTADMEMSPEAWMQAAERGISLASESWEKLACEFYDDPLLFAEAKNLLKDWTEDELERRFTKWLFERFFVQAGILDNLSERLDEAQLHYTWHLDEDGNVIFDPASGDPEPVRPWEEGREIESDRYLWRDEVRAALEGGEAAYQEFILYMIPEVLCYIGEDERSGLEQSIRDMLAEKKFNLRKEFEELASREERLFLARRTGDYYSLRRKSEDKAAAEITAELIGAAQAVCDEGISALKSRIDAAEAGTGDLALAGEEWLEQYRIQFERGLNAWTEAEERFLVRRLEWQRDADERYDTGNEEWSEAFRQFEIARLKWERDADELLKAGELLFKEASQTLEKAIAEAKIEFAQDAQKRIDAGASKAKAYVDIYITSSQVLTGARENVRFWGQRYDGGAPDIFSSYFPAWINREIEFYEEETSVLIGRDEEGEDIFADISNKEKYAAKYEVFQIIYEWWKLFMSYYARALEARTALAEDFALVMGSGALKDILDEGVNTEDFNLDEYQIELIKARAVASYWERRTEITRAVLNYAEDLSSGRVTEAEGIEAFETAKKDYHEAIDAYEKVQAELSDAGLDVLDAQKKLLESSKKLNEAEARLEELNQAYSVLLGVYRTSRTDIIEEQLKNEYEKLLETVEQLDRNGADAPYINYLERAIELSRAQDLETLGTALKMLVLGDGGKSLETLQEEADAVRVFGADSVPVSIAATGIKEDNPRYETISYLFRGRDENPEEAAAYNVLIAGFTTLAKEEADAALEIRMEGLKLLLANSFSMEDCYIKAEQSRLSLIKARAELEYDALGCLLGIEEDNEEADNEEEDNEEEDNEEAEILSAFYSGDPADTVFINGLMEVLNNLIQAIHDSDERRITALADENETIRRFLNGENLFFGTEAFVHEALSSYYYRQGLFEIYQSIAFMSDAGRKMSWNKSTAELKLLFESMNIEAGEGYLPSVDKLALYLLDDPSKTEEALTEFLCRFDHSLNQLPSWIKAEIEEWKSAIIDLAAAGMIDASISPAWTREDIANKLEETTGKIDTLRLMYEGLSFSGKQAFDEFNEAYLELDEEYRILNNTLLLIGAHETMREAMSRDGSDNKKHWREYITEENTGTDDPGIITAFSYPEGLLIDAKEKISRITMLLNDAFTVCDTKMAEALNVDFIAIADAYINDTKLAWDENNIKETRYLLVENYNHEKREYKKLFSYEEIYRKDIAIVASMLDIAKNQNTNLAEEIRKMMKQMEDHANEIEALSIEYDNIAQLFLLSGEKYDILYAQSKEFFEKMEDARFSYEKKDAVNRWAATAYLGVEDEREELSRSAEHLMRAKAALEALASLYDGNAERRPYVDAEYENLYQKYRENFSNMLVALNTLDRLEEAIANETIVNAGLYMDYMATLKTFGGDLSLYEKNDYDYVSPSDKSAWGIQDIITVKNGKLVFNFESGFRLKGTDYTNSALLAAYFNEGQIIGNETNDATDFELGLRNLEAFFLSMGLNRAKYERLALARDFLVACLTNEHYAGGNYVYGDLPYFTGFPPVPLVSSNEDIAFLKDYYDDADNIKSGTFLGQHNMSEYQNAYYGRYVSDYISSQGGKYIAAGKSAWESLSAEEQENLMFYLILTMNGSGGSGAGALEGFRKATSYLKYREVYEYSEHNLNYANDRTGIWIIGPAYWQPIANRLNNVVNDLRVPVDYTSKEIDQAMESLISSITDMDSAYARYFASCERLAGLKGEKKDGDFVRAADILYSFSLVGNISNFDTSIVMNIWDRMLLDSGETYSSVLEALQAVNRWIKSEKEDSKRSLEKRYSDDQAKRLEAEGKYHQGLEAYMNGNINLSDLKSDMEKAFGENAAALKNHLENLDRVIREDIETMLTGGRNYRNEYGLLLGEMEAILERVYSGRYQAELGAREAVWQEQRRDLVSKLSQWREDAALLIQRGREDWISGAEKMKIAYNEWNRKFLAEYERIGEEWNGAYLAGLEDKEAWLKQAEEAANHALSGAALALLGEDAEAGARKIDTRDPMLIRIHAGEDISFVMDEIMSLAGIAATDRAFAAINGVTGTIASHVQKGVGGPSSWNAGILQSAARQFAREANEKTAELEAKRLLQEVKEAAEKSSKQIAENIDKANNSFRKNMNRLFVIDNIWSLADGKYTKDVVVYSSLTKTESEYAEVETYRDYIVDPFELKTDTSASALNGLNYLAIQGLIRNIEDEIKREMEKHFGRSGEGGKEIVRFIISEWDARLFFTEVMVDGNMADSSGNIHATSGDGVLAVEELKRVQDPGKFGEHIGYEPLFRSSDTGSKEAMFWDQGRGELGRLMTDYTWWRTKEGKGIAMVNAAFWDKPVWDDRNSAFKAFTIRETADVVGKVAATATAVALSPVSGGSSMGLAAMAFTVAAVETADDLIFSVMDVGGGYKAADTALFDYSKSFAVSLGTNLISGAFNGLSGLEGTFGTTTGGGIKGLVNAASASDGIGRSLSLGVLSGMERALSGTYAGMVNAVQYTGGGLTFSNDVFNQSMSGLGTGMLSGMASAFTGGILNSYASGLYNDLGINGNNLNNFIAGSTAELIDYAYTGDFTFNLLNAGIIPGLREMGLLELHLGDEGPFMKFGSDGVDVSMLGTQILNAGISSLIDVITGINRREEIIIERPVYPEEELEPVPDTEERAAALLERDEAETEEEERASALPERNEAETESVPETPELKEPELDKSELKKREAERLYNEKKKNERESLERNGEEQLEFILENYADTIQEIVHGHKGLLDQKTLAKIVGLYENETCFVDAVMILYLLNASTYEAKYYLLQGIVNSIKNGSVNGAKTKENSKVEDFDKYSKTMAQTLNGKDTKEIWEYGKSFTDAAAFFNSGYEYGVMVYEKNGAWDIPDEKRSRHFLLVDNKNDKIYDPWPGGIGSTWKNDYFLKEIRSLKKIKKEK
ncbi:MAG: hypothetical protein LBE10_04980 [Treponema sp.]|jgi:hypothetical protein|nr:hypothetical protein [Treponema sp.]